MNAEFDLGKYHFNPRLRELTFNGKVQTLSPKENELLKMLSEYRNDLLPRDDEAAKLLGVRLHPLDAAIEHALREWEATEPLAAR